MREQEPGLLGSVRGFAARRRGRRRPDRLMAAAVAIATSPTADPAYWASAPTRHVGRSGPRWGGAR
jgi:hypothetical protein